MAFYRIYSVSKDGRIRAMPIEIDLPNDGEAIKLARSRLNGLDLEVWEGRRQVAVLKAVTNSWQ
jgi:hypothetical protein